MNTDKLWIVFDIDGTLSTTIDHDEYNSLTESDKEYFSSIQYKQFENRDIIKEAWVMPRPHLKELLNFCFEHFRVGVWSVGQPGYVDSIVQHLFKDNGPEFIYNFTHCSREYNPIRIYKPLLNSPAKGGYIIEDSPECIDTNDRSIIIDRFDITCYDFNDNSDLDDNSDLEDINLDDLIGDDTLLVLMNTLSKIISSS